MACGSGAKCGTRFGAGSKFVVEHALDSFEVGDEAAGC